QGGSCHPPALLCPQGPAGGSEDDCATELFTAAGECCRACNVGEGVVQPCGVNQTVCEPCLDSVTFSDTVSATEPCRPCTQCGGLQSMSAPCVESDDAVCVCAYGYFQDESSGSCRECRVCEAGFGLMFACKGSQDTVCEECPEGTFSSEANFVDPCLPCTACEENELQVRECTATADAECRGESGAGLGRGAGEVALSWLCHCHTVQCQCHSCAVPLSRLCHCHSSVIVTAVQCQCHSSVIVTVLSLSLLCWGAGTGEVALSLLCSVIVTAVLSLSLLCHVTVTAVQCQCHSCAVPLSQFCTPQGRTQPPQHLTRDPISPLPAPKAEGSPFAALPASKQQEVEKLLASSAQDSWRQLAGELGYQQELIDSFTREESPARALLAHWGRRESATLEALLAALRRAQRGDIADSLASGSSATSPV
ncbi:TNR16 factor, partial [Copsychus sechellarum]|nr:TNR16 factor [Copsychus sechellarum]